MTTNLTPKSPTEFPNPVEMPTAGSSLLWEGGIRTTLTQIADRTDHLKAQFAGFAINGTNATSVGATWTDIAGASVSLGSLKLGDVVMPFLGVKSTAQVRVVVTDGTTTVVLGVATAVPNDGAWTAKIQQYSGTCTNFSCGILVRRP